MVVPSNGAFDAAVDERRSTLIRRQNDAFRRALVGASEEAAPEGRVLMTRGVQALGADMIRRIMVAMAGFDGFNDENDPWGEHEFIALEIEGRKVFAKIDYYDRAYEFGSPDPADPRVTRRVLTIMLASDY